jgi:hypothetical protein
MENRGEMILTGENRMTLRKTYPTATVLLLLPQALMVQDGPLASVFRVS